MQLLIQVEPQYYTSEVVWDTVDAVDGPGPGAWSAVVWAVDDEVPCLRSDEIRRFRASVPHMAPRILNPNPKVR